MDTEKGKPIFSPSVEERLTEFNRFRGYGWWWLNFSIYNTTMGIMYGIKVGPLAIHFRWNYPSKKYLYEQWTWK